MTGTQHTLADAVGANVRPGDTVLLTVGHSRWTAAARELVRQTWGSNPGFTLVMLSLSSLGALFFTGIMLSPLAGLALFVAHLYLRPDQFAPDIPDFHIPLTRFGAAGIGPRSPRGANPQKQRPASNGQP